MVVAKSRFDILGDRMKEYEAMETGRRLMRGLPIMVRLDGRNFHGFTAKLQRPFDERMSRAMIETARELVDEFHASFGYTQSDEISLGFRMEHPTSQFLFGLRIQKLVSVMAASCSVRFYKHVLDRIPEKRHLNPVFDARVFNMPNLDEMTECIRFRALDCAKNSLATAAAAHYPQKELQKKSGREQHDLLHAKGINWSKYPAFFKDGTFLRRETVQRTLSAAKLAAIPEQHRRDGSFQRSVVVEVPAPPFNRLANPKGFLFFGEAPLALSDANAKQQDELVEMAAEP